MIKCIKVVKKKSIMGVFKKINKVLRITILIALLLLIFGISYAYFTANISGSESSTTISVNAGTMEITFSGGLDITMNNIYPRDEVWGTKNFAVTGNSTTILPMYYSLSLVVETNTFVNNDLKYILLFTNTGSNGDALIPVGMQSIPSGTNDLVIGSGFFTGPTGGNKVHNFTLEFYFPETGENQNDNKGKSFAAHVKIEEGIQELASGTISGLKDTVLFANGTSAGIKAIEQRDALLLSSSPGPLWIYEMNSPEKS